MFKAVWGDGYTPQEQITGLDFFCEYRLYLAEDTADINNLKDGETWTSDEPAVHTVLSYGEQVVFTDSRGHVNQELVLTYGRYSNGNLFISALTTDEDSQKVWCDVTSNWHPLTEQELATGLICVRDLFDGEGIAQLLIDCGIIETIVDADSGLYTLHPEVLKVALSTIDIINANKSEVES